MEPQDSNSSLSSSSQFQRLPPEALDRVLGAVPQQQRLAVCALVCRAWRDAALAATTQLELAIALDQSQRSAQLSAWLARHGSGLHNLSVSCFRSYPAPISLYRLYSSCIGLELPWASLRQLWSLSFREVDVPCSSSTTSTSSSSTTAGAASQAGPSNHQQLAQLTSLTSLVLKGCTISSGVLDLYQQQLPALRQLQELVIEAWRDANWAADGLGAALAAALTQLTALTRLRVATRDDAAAISSLSSLSSLQQLQVLELEGRRQPGGDDTPLSISWSDLPASVTALELSGCTAWRLQPARGSHVAHTAQHHCGQARHDAAVPGIPQLRRLAFTAWFAEKDAVAATRALLAALAQQQQLQSLSVHCDLILPAEQTLLYAALAASSQLTALSVRVEGETPAPAVLSAILGAGRRLPLLQRFRLLQRAALVNRDSAWGLAPQDVSRLLQACLGLRELTFLPASSDDAAAAAGAGATWSDAAGAAAAQLTKVVVGSSNVNAAFISHFLARLTGLQDLTMRFSHNITWAALVPLTRLTGLMRLAVEVAHGLLRDGLLRGEFELVNQAGPGQPPDVSQRLRAMCWDEDSASCVVFDQQEQQQPLAQ